MISRSEDRPSIGSPALEQDALSELAPHIRRWVFRYVGPCADYEDLVQEAMIEVARALPRFRGESNLTTYARRIVMRTVGSHRRRHRKTTQHLVVVASEMGRALDDPERRAVAQQDVQRLYDALAQLSLKLRNAVVLCDLEGCSHEEAAEVEGIDLHAMRARLKRGRAQLREILASGGRS